MALTARFPKNLVDYDPYFIQFDFYKLDPLIVSETDAPLSTSGIKSAFESLGDVQSSFDYSTRTDEIQDTVQLPLQQAVTEETNLTYSESSTKDLGQISSAISEISGGGANLGEIVSGVLGGMSGDGAMGAIRDAVNNFQGRAVNEQMQLFFDKPERRDYSFEFNLVARNREDAIEMQKIRKLLNYHASPGLSPTQTYYTYPSIVKFSFQRIVASDNGKDESVSRVDSLYKSKYCYITSVNITHGDEKYRQFTDGTYRNTGMMKITVSLKEADYFIRESEMSNGDYIGDYSRDLEE